MKHDYWRRNRRNRRVRTFTTGTPFGWAGHNVLGVRLAGFRRAASIIYVPAYDLTPETRMAVEAAEAAKQVAP